MEDNKNKAPKKLYRITDGRMICGVCGGMAEYFRVDVSIVRLVIVLLTFTGYGLLIYIVAAVIIPEQWEVEGRKSTDDSGKNCDSKEKSEEEEL